MGGSAYRAPFRGLFLVRHRVFICFRFFGGFLLQPERTKAGGFGQASHTLGFDFASDRYGASIVRRALILRLAAGDSSLGIALAHLHYLSRKSGVMRANEKDGPDNAGAALASLCVRPISN